MCVPADRLKSFVSFITGRYVVLSTVVDDIRRKKSLNENLTGYDLYSISFEDKRNLDLKFKW